MGAGIGYVIISKNTANRMLAGNELLRAKEVKAVYVDRKGGIEYGWLVRPVDLLGKGAQDTNRG